MKEEQQVRSEIALGVIPNGVMNDFARYWGFSEGDVEQTVDWLKTHRVRTIDLGCVRYENKQGERCHRYFLNCVNVGLIADVMNLRRQTRSLLGSRTLSFLVSIFLMIFHRMDYKMRVKINSDIVDRKVMTMCVEEAKHALVGVDGRLLGVPVGAYTITIEQEVINFLIPV